MKRVLCLALVLAVGAVAPAVGTARNCVPDQGCHIGEGRPQCCNPPPCDLLRRLVTAKAMVRMLAGPNIAEALGVTDGDFDEALKMLERTRPKEPGIQCEDSGEETVLDPLPLVVAPEPSCAIGLKGDSFTKVSWEEALERSRTCEELESAQYDRLYVEQAACLERSKEKAPRGKDEDDLAELVEHADQRRRFDALRKGWQEQAKSLELDLINFIRVCTHTSLGSMLDIGKAIDAIEKDSQSKKKKPIQRKSKKTKKPGARARKGA